MKLNILLALVLLVMSCKSKKSATKTTITETPYQAEIEKTATMYPGYTLAQFNDGKTLYTENCGLCHALVLPGKLTKDEWIKIVPPMAKGVNKKNGNSFDASKEDLVLKYLITLSKSN